MAREMAVRPAAGRAINAIEADGGPAPDPGIDATAQGSSCVGKVCGARGPAPLPRREPGALHCLVARHRRLFKAVSGRAACAHASRVPPLPRG